MHKARLALLTGTHLVNDLYQGVIPAMLPFLMTERHYGYAAVSGLAFAASGVSSLFQPLFGIVADRGNRSWLVPAGFCTAASGVVAAGLATSYPLTWLWLAVAGIGIAAFHPPATSQARLAGGTSQRAMSVFSVGGTLGGALAPGLVTLVIGRLGFGGSPLLAVPAAVMAVIWLLRRRTPGGAPGTAQKTAAAAPARADDWRAFGRLVVVIIGWSIPFVTVTSLISLHAQRDLGRSTAASAAVLTCFTAAGAAGTLLGGWAGDRYGRLVALRTGFLVSLPALAAVAWAPTYVVLAVAATVLGTGMFLPFAAQVTLAQDYLPSRPGTASGLTLGLAMAAGGLCAPLFGRLADAGGLRTTFWVLVAVFAGCVVLALRLADPLRATPAPHEVLAAQR
ncbi:MFS transporter [Dactylosporangium sp. AC04546]|uniref:MFS transporter n=1 Tax=Dactylosporangium sp. AC04546 TaxID=2862460 RepID=UPI001EDF7422|nr:MFS transporter [Dactylosporangium sp. AC04546]WVK88553.1 MFS transporter [Dactylosporangium sp. AC04546]